MAISDTVKCNHYALFPGLLSFIGHPRTLNGLAAINECAPAPRTEGNTT